MKSRRPSFRSWLSSHGVAALLRTDTNHSALLFNPAHQVPLLGAPRVRIDAQDRTDARLLLLAILPLIRAADGRDGRWRRVAGGGGGALRRCSGVAAAAGSPCLLQHGRVHAGTVVGGDGGPEGCAVGAVDGVEAAHVDGGRRRGGGAVEAQGRGGRGGGGGGRGGGGEGGGREQRCAELRLGGVVLQGRVARGAEGEGHVGGLGQDGGQARGVGGGVVVVVVGGVAHDGGELDGGAVAAEGARGRDGARGGLVDGRGDGGEHDGRVAGRRRRRRHGRGALAAVAAVAELVVVQAAGELCLLEVRGDVLVGHLL